MALPDISPGLLDFIKGQEGFSSTPYFDYKQYTSGYGTRAQSPDEVIDQATAEQRLSKAIGDARSFVDSVAPDAPSGVKDALTSLTYNAGTSWANAGLGQAIRSGDYGRARDLFLQYDKAGGQVNPGLVKRRQAEASFFDNPMGSAGPMPPRASGAHPVGAAAIPPAAAPMLPNQSQSPASPLQGLLQAPVQAASGNAGDALQSFWQALPAQQPQALPPMFAPPRPPPVDLRQLRQVFPLPGQAPGFLIG